LFVLFLLTGAEVILKPSTMVGCFSLSLLDALSLFDDFFFLSFFDFLSFFLSVFCLTGSSSLGKL